MTQDRSGLRVLYATGSLHAASGGPCWTVKQTADALRGAGHEAIVVGTKDRWQQGPPTTWRPHPAHSFAKVGPYSLHCSPQIGSWVRRHLGPVDVVSLENLWIFNHRPVARWCRQHEIPYLLTPHGAFNEFALTIASWKKRIARRLFVDETLSGVRCFHALTESEYEAIRRFGLRQPVCVIPNGVGLPAPREALGNPAQTKGDGRKMCLYLGRLHPIKGLENLLEAWSRLGEKRHGWRLAIAGPDSVGYQATLEAAVARLDLGADVGFVGPRYGDAKSRLFYSADFFVLPSLSEGMPMAALEAMAHGLPVLLTDRCGLASVDAEGSGCVVPSDVDGLRQGLAGMIALTDARRRDMGSRARRWVERDYSWNRVVSRLEDLFHWMLGRRDPPATVRFD